MPERQGIPTVFRGIEYRSRLEAKWAAFFYHIHWKFEYEPFDGNGYIPDFLIQNGGNPFLVEVKPAVTLEDYKEPWDKINDGLSDCWNGPVLVVGVSPLPQCFWDSEFFPSVAGSMSLREHGVCDTCCHAYWEEHGRVIWDGWDVCDHDARPTCEHWKWFWQHQSGHGSPRWALQEDLTTVTLSYDGDYGKPFCDNIGGLWSPRQVESVWAASCNDVKWRGR